ncbi:MAG: DUF4905 domain-containing protein [Bacteroidota bacterium]
MTHVCRSALSNPIPPPQFVFSFDGHIWTMGLDHANGLLVLEIRDATTRRVSFAAVDLGKNDSTSHALLWKDFQPEHSWWLSLVGVYNGVLLLHRYADSQRPEAKGILAVEVRSCRVLWQQPDWAFMDTDGEVVILHQQGADQSPVYQQIDLRSGKSLAITEIPTVPNPQPPSPDIQYPVHYPEQSPYFQPIARFLHQKLGIQPIQAFDYAEFQGLIVVSYYLCAPDSPLSNKVVVLDNKACVLLHESMATHLNGIGMDTFLIRKGSLLFVREKKELVSYTLA